MSDKMRAIISANAKGGTGKTLVAINLAYELSRVAQVGLFDADIDSANVYECLGMVGQKIGLTEDRRFVPMEHNGIKVFSIGGYFDDNTKGISMSGQSMRQMIIDAIRETEWGDIDYLVVDSPAGTSADKLIAIKETLGDDLLGCVITTQPNIQQDVRRIVDLCARHRIRVLGIIENMSGLTCSNGHVIKCHECGEIITPFGVGGGRILSEELSLDFLGAIPLSQKIREGLESGDPYLDDNSRAAIETLARKVLSINIPHKKGILQRIRTFVGGRADG